MKTPRSRTVEDVVITVKPIKGPKVGSRCWLRVVLSHMNSVYPHKWSPVSYRSRVGQGKFAGRRPTFFRCATQPTNGRGQGHVILFLNFALIIMCGIGEARNLKFLMLIDTQEYVNDLEGRFC